MAFAGFVGNEKAVAVLGRMLEQRRVPAALLLAGQKGVGKYTLACHFTRVLLCEQGRTEACGRCGTCRALAVLDDLEGLRRAALDPEEVPLLLQPHPDVTLVVPDPTYIRMSQMRAARRIAYHAPSRGRRVILMDDAERLRPDFASTLLKVLEEPPAHTHFLLISHAPDELPVTIRSRTMRVSLAPVPREAIQAYLGQHRPELTKKDRALVASAAGGSLGTALRLDPKRYRAAQAAALTYLRAAAGEALDPGDLFAATAELAGRGRRESEEEGGTGSGRAEFEFSLGVLYSLASDVLYLKAQASGLGLHNPDVRSELERLSQRVDWNWLASQVWGLDSIDRGLRRNLNRQLALDALTVGRPSGETGETPGTLAASE
jgi:DNA polymerase-3 subunit delta'